MYSLRNGIAYTISGSPIIFKKYDIFNLTLYLLRDNESKISIVRTLQTLDPQYNSNYFMLFNDSSAETGSPSRGTLASFREASGTFV